MLDIFFLRVDLFNWRCHAKRMNSEMGDAWIRIAKLRRRRSEDRRPQRLTSNRRRAYRIDRRRHLRSRLAKFIPVYVKRRRRLIQVVFGTIAASKLHLLEIAYLRLPRCGRLGTGPAKQISGALRTSLQPWSEWTRLSAVRLYEPAVFGKSLGPTFFGMPEVCRVGAAGLVA